MKQTLLTIGLLYAVTVCYGQLTFTASPNFATPTDKYAKFEVDFNLSFDNAMANPYDPDEVDCYAIFTSPSGKIHKQFAFYYQSYNKTDVGHLAINGGSATTAENLNKVVSGDDWRIRFTPDEVGEWKFKITVTESQSGFSQTIYSPTTGYHWFSVSQSNLPGHITVKNGRYMSRTTDEPYYPIGVSDPGFQVNNNPQNGALGSYGSNQIKSDIDEMSNVGINFFRFEINFFDGHGTGLNLMGYDKEQQKNFCNYYNQKDAYRLDKIIEYANENGVNLLLALFAHNYLGIDGGGVINYRPPGTSTNTNLDHTGMSGYCHGSFLRQHPYFSGVMDNSKPTFPDEKGDLDNPYEWYSKNSAKEKQKKLIRYILARWGYATNLMGYELMDEADRIKEMNKNGDGNNDIDPANDWIDAWITPPTSYEQDIVDWHEEMSDFMRANDAHDHLITTAFSDRNFTITNEIYSNMDFSQIHFYKKLTNGDGTVQGWWNDQTRPEEEYRIETGKYVDLEFQGERLNIPTMVGEFYYISGADKHYNGDNTMPKNLAYHDPNLYQLHTMLWSTMHSGSCGPASMWEYRDFDRNDIVSSLNVYEGISEYVGDLPQLSEIYEAKKSIVNGLYICTLEDENGDEIYGWMQDENMKFANIHKNYNTYLDDLDPALRPSNASSTNTVSFSVSRSGNYNISWYNTIDGSIHSTTSLSTTVFGGNTIITVTMPSSLRSSEFGDAGFIVQYDCSGQWNTTVLRSSVTNVRSGSPTATASNGNSSQVNYIGSDNRIYQMWYNGQRWAKAILDATSPTNVRTDSDLGINASGNRIYYAGTDNRIHEMKWDVDEWKYSVLNIGAPQNVQTFSSIHVDLDGKVLFIGTDKRIHSYEEQGGVWNEQIVFGGSSQDVLLGSDIITDANDNIFYIGTDFLVHCLEKVVGGYIYYPLNAAANPNVRTTTTLLGLITISDSPLGVDGNGNIYYVGNDNRVHSYTLSGSIWTSQALSASAPSNVRSGTDMVILSNKVIFTATDNKLHQYYHNGSSWIEAMNSASDPANVANGSYGMSTDGNTAFFVSTSNSVWASFYGCDEVYRSSQKDDRIHSNNANDNHEINTAPSKDVNTVSTPSLYQEATQVYPNPATSQILISCPESIKRVTLIDLRGKEVVHVNNVNDKTTQLNVSQLPAGVYSIVITTSSSTVVKRLVKQ